MEAQKYVDFPYEIKDVDPKAEAEFLKYFKGQNCGFVHVGPHRCFLPKPYEKVAARLYNLPLRRDDTFVVTYPRSGTTWMQELVWLVSHDLDYDAGSKTPLIKRFPFLELMILIDPNLVKRIKEESKGNEGTIASIESLSSSTIDEVEQMPSPRFIKSHLPLSLLPPTLLDTTKVVFVARDPRDVAVSFYHHNRLIKAHDFVGDFKQYWNFFINDLIYYAPFFKFNKEAWNKRDHPNMLFLFYEELIKDLPAVIRRVSKFLGKEYNEEQVAKLADHLQFDNFKNNKAVNDEPLKGVGILNEGAEKFIRKGKSGGWREYFDEEMTRQAENWIQKNLQGTDFRFPEA